MPESKDAHDLFVAHEVYPDARAIFSWKAESLASIMASSLVVLDTNALLLPYTVGAKSLSEIKDKFRALASQDRLRIPGQVAREFARNRPARLADLYKEIGIAKSKAAPLNVGNYPLLDGMEAYKQARTIEGEINALIRDYQRALATVLDDIRQWDWNDPLSELYREIFTPDIIVEPELEQSDIKNDLAYRQKNKIPPGYKDSSKEDDGIGDLLIWTTMLHLGATTSQSLLFVSGEKKADWWHRSGGEPLYPRHELVDEYRRASDGGSFHIATLSELLNLVGASADVIEEVRQEEADEEEWPDEATPITVNMLREDWPLIRSRVEKANRRTASLLQPVWPLSVDDGQVMLTSPYEFHRDRLNQPEVGSVVEHVLSQLYNQDVSIWVVSDVPF